jgi:hypothetical protein
MQHSKLTDYLKRSAYKLTPEAFDRYRLSHRKHQRSALLKAAAELIGQILSPCGTGKTRIQVSMHIQSMLDLQAQGEYGVHVIASHRLSLNTQLLDQLVDVAINTGLPIDIIYIGSYKCDLQKYYAKYSNLGYTPAVSRHLIHTSQKEIFSFIEKAKELNRHVIVASTYHSIDALIGCRIKLATFDEAQNTVEKNFTENLLMVKPSIERQFFFTATRKVCGKDGGMNDKDFYGEVIFDAPPSEMLAEGEIVCPELHLVDSVDGKTFNTTDQNMLVKNIMKVYLEHETLVKKYSCAPDEIAAKLLVSFNGIEEMKRVHYDPNFQAFLKCNSIKCFTTDSTYGNFVNGISCSRDELLKQMNALKDTDRVLLFHVDILTEGIDLPAITGVMPLRNLNINKLFQLLGRALRLHLKDRKGLYNGDIIPKNYKDYIKPYGWLIIPRHMESLDDHPKMIQYIGDILAEYKTPAEEFLLDEKFIDPENEPLSSMIKKDFQGGKDYELYHTEQTLVDEVELYIRLKEFRAMQEHEQLNFLQRQFS